MPNVVVYPADVAGCGHVRLIWAGKHLARQGYPVTVIPPGDRTGIAGEIDTKTGRVINVSLPAGTEVVVLQRVLRDTIARDVIDILRSRGIAVVVDMDDALSWVDPSNYAFTAMHPRNYPKRNWEWAALACEKATLVTLSTPKLVELYARGRKPGEVKPHEIIRNCVPADFTRIPHEDSDIIGWGGALALHPKDMEPVGGALARLEREGAEFGFVGPGAGLRAALRLSAEPYATGPVDIDQWPFMLAQTMGIGMTPLADTQFNAAKSHLKPLEMMALGIPVVSSPSAEYRYLLEQTNIGFIARKPDQWYRRLRELRSDPVLRRDWSEAGRAAVLENWTIEGNAWRWWEAWERAYKIQQEDNPLGLPR
jgi:glycosyltransferase involved in cell wall biosynthesis